jgi:cytochrome c peroxidase
VVYGIAIFLLAASAAGIDEGQRLFDNETFGGNGRTCRTCHSGSDGTIDPQEVAERLARDPSDSLFVHDGLDDFFSGTSRIAAHATILIERELPEGVVLLDDPSISSPQLFGVRHTAPYFHDNSAKTLEEVLEQYKFMFTSNLGFPITYSNILLTDQDVKDIIAFLKLL